MNERITDFENNQISRTPLRSDLYALLAALLVKPPAEDTLKRISRLTSTPDMPPQLDACLQQLKDAASGACAESVAREFADLFIGLGRGEIVPYASWYIEKLLQAAPLARLRADLSALNICRQAEVCEPEDHAGALCETMVLIIAAPQVSARRQAEFFRDHLATWLPPFFRDLQQARSALFYRPVGLLGEQFMLLEKGLLQPLTIEEV